MTSDPTPLFTTQRTYPTASEGRQSGILRFNGHEEARRVQPGRWSGEGANVEAPSASGTAWLRDTDETRASRTRNSVADKLSSRCIQNGVLRQIDLAYSVKNVAANPSERSVGQGEEKIGKRGIVLDSGCACLVAPCLGKLGSERKKKKRVTPNFAISN